MFIKLLHMHRLFYFCTIHAHSLCKWAYYRRCQLCLFIVASSSWLWSSSSSV